MKIMWSRVNLTNRFVKFTPIQVISIVWLNKRGGSSCHIISKSSMGTKLLRGDTKITSNRREEPTRIRMLIGAAFRIENDCFTCIHAQDLLKAKWCKSWPWIILWHSKAITVNKHRLGEHLSVCFTNCERSYFPVSINTLQYAYKSHRSLFSLHSTTGLTDRQR